MRTEISQAKKENQFYLSSVERSKALKRIEDRKRKRGEEMDLSGIKRNTDKERQYLVEMIVLVLPHVFQMNYY